MPTYSYQCKKCAHIFDVFHAMSAKPNIECEACGENHCERLLGTGAGIIFKGSGFYETDFKDKKGKPASSGTSSTKTSSSTKESKGAASTKSDSSSKTMTKGG